MLNVCTQKINISAHFLMHSCGMLYKFAVRKIKVLIVDKGLVLELYLASIGIVLG